MAVEWEWGAGLRPSWAQSLPEPPTARYRPGRGIFGGTFDPPHIGHLILAEMARSALRLSEVVFIPAAQPPHKLEEEITDPKHRLAMTELAVATNDRFSLSTVDLDREGPSYTVDTLRLLRREWGQTVDIYFIIGADMLVDFPTWYEPAQILKLCRLAVVRRPGVEVDLEALEREVPGLRDRVYLVPAPLIGISSTEIRRRVRAGRTIKYLVLPEVEAYVAEQELYGSEERTEEQLHSLPASAS